MSDMEEKANRLRALWKSGRDKYVSFYSTLNEVRAEIGDKDLPDWCFDNLRIGFSVIISTKKLIGEADAAIIKDNLAAAKLADDLRKREEREERAHAALEKHRAKEEEQRRKQLERQARELSAAEHKRKLAELAAQTTELKITQERSVETRKEEKEEKSPAPAQRRKREVVSDLGQLDAKGLISRFKQAEAMCIKGDNFWIEGSIAKATILCAARDKFHDNEEFGKWLEKTGIDISHQNRSALINLGRLGEKRLREILAATESRSYRVIWEQHKPSLKIVEN